MRQAAIVGTASLATLAAAESGRRGPSKRGEHGGWGGNHGGWGGNHGGWSGSWGSGGGHGNGDDCPLPTVESEPLQDALTIEDLMGHCAAFQSFADMTEEVNRHTGSTGHNATVEYIYQTISEMSDYWDVEYQPFNVTIQIYGRANLTVDGTDYNVVVMDNSPSKSLENVEMVLVNNLGCEQSDYPAELKGKVALISRGECTFSSKSARAGVAGALGAVVYNNEEGNLQGTLGGEDEIGPHVPTAGLSKADGETIAALLSSGASPSVTFVTDTLIENVYTKNVIATTKSGDPENLLFLGAHSDSVFAGPGINDNGSGSSSLLALAKALSGFSVTNQVRLAWWSAEEHGLLGSEYYVANAAAETLAKIRLYLNFDMIASPNYVLAVYDGSGGAFNLTGPAGSAEAQALFESYFASQGLPTVPTEFNGRSDYGPFLDANVPCGGLFTGAEELKTEEEAALFGGTAGVALDENYHQAGDNYDNLNPVAFEANGKAIAHAVATYAASWEGFPERVPVAEGKIKFTKRSHVHHHGPKKRDASRPGVSMSCGGHEGEVA